MSPALFIGLDAGGTATRWAAVDPQGRSLGEGQVNGFSGLHLSQTEARAQLARTLAQLAQDLAPLGQVVGVVGGVTGISDPTAALTLELNALIAQALSAPHVACHSDMHVAFHAAFQPGEGYLVYAGTGSIATHIDAQGTLHRAGGRGFALGDEGGGYWIAKEALAAIWRREDEAPGSWPHSGLARAVFSSLGGSDWALTRQFVYANDRGTVGRLALAVAEAAGLQDPEACALLHRAGQELGRLGAVLRRRMGPKPVVAAGRVLLLHPLVAEGLRAALPADCPLQTRQLAAHHAAARLALTSFAA
jgi:glucosamine kinase